MNKKFKDFLIINTLGRYNHIKNIAKEKLKQSQFIKKFKTWGDSFLSTQYVRAKDLTQTAIFILVYGAMISSTAYYLFGFPFSFPILLSFGVVFYFLKMEIPQIISSSITRGRQ